MSPLGVAAVALAGFVAGMVNTMIGSGSLLSFPTLVAVGFDPLTANVSNSLGLVPGSVAGAVAYRPELAGQGRRLRRLLVPAAAGGLTGAALLLLLPPGVFEVVVPLLVALAAVLVLVQPWLRQRIRRQAPGARGGAGLVAGIFLAGAYGGYFGAAQGVLLLGLLGLSLSDDLQRLNAVKNVIAAVVNGVAVALFVFTAPLAWSAALVLAVCSAVGGHLGVRLARRVPETPFRVAIAVLGLAVAAWLQFS